MPNATGRNAADCILAAERPGPAYRDLTFAIAESWLSLARQQASMVERLAIWSKAQAAASAAPYGCLSNIPANQVAVGSLRCKRGKRFPPRPRLEPGAKHG
jgi:hypothetical protein